MHSHETYFLRLKKFKSKPSNRVSLESGKRIYGGKHAKTLAKIQVGAIFQVRDIRRNSSPKFIDLCKETPCWWPIRVVPTWRAETNVVPEFCYESVNSYLEELINF